MKRNFSLLLLCLLCLAESAQADVYRCLTGRKVPVYTNIACGPDAERLDLSGIPIMVRHPDDPPAPKRSRTRPSTPRPVASSSADAAQIEAWAKASRERLPPSLGGKARAPAKPRPQQITANVPAEAACGKARTTLSEAEQRAWESGKRLSYAELRRLNDAIFDACY